MIARPQRPFKRYFCRHANSSVANAQSARYGRGMTIPNEIATIESRITQAGVSLADFLKLAGVDNSTWWRWKTGNATPLLTSWRAVEAQIAKLPKKGKVA